MEQNLLSIVRTHGAQPATTTHPQLAFLDAAILRRGQRHRAPKPTCSPLSAAHFASQEAAAQRRRKKLLV